MSIIRKDAPKGALVVYITIIIVFFVPIVFTTIQLFNAMRTGDAVTAIVYDSQTIKRTSGSKIYYLTNICVQYTHNGIEFIEWLDSRNNAGIVLVDSEATLYVDKTSSKVIFDPWRWPESLMFFLISVILLLPFFLKRRKSIEGLKASL